MRLKDCFRKIIIVALGSLLIVPVIVTILAVFKEPLKETVGSILLMVRGTIWAISFLRPVCLHIGVILLLLFILYRISSEWKNYSASRRLIITAAVNILIITGTAVQLGYNLCLINVSDRVQRNDLNTMFMFFYILSFILIVFNNITARDKRTIPLRNTLSVIYCIPAIVFAGCVIMEVAAIVGTFGLVLKIWYDTIAFFEGPFHIFGILWMLVIVVVFGILLLSLIDLSKYSVSLSLKIKHLVLLIADQIVIAGMVVSAICFFKSNNISEEILQFRYNCWFMFIYIIIYLLSYLAYLLINKDRTVLYERIILVVSSIPATLFVLWAVGIVVLEIFDVSIGGNISGPFRTCLGYICVTSMVGMVCLIGNLIFSIKDICSEVNVRE